MDEEPKKPNYKPINPRLDENFPKLEYSSPNPSIKKSIPKKSSLSYISFPDVVNPMYYDLMRLGRSVVAGCLVQRYDMLGYFTPMNTEIMLYYLKEDYLISSIEKEALMKLGEGKGEEDEEAMIMGLNDVLVTIERDTGGVLCEVLRNLNGKGKKRIEVRDIDYSRLLQEMMPRPRLLLQDLVVSAEDILEEERRQQLRLAALSESGNWYSPPTKSAPVTNPTRPHSGARISRIRPRVKKVE